MPSKDCLEEGLSGNHFHVRAEAAPRGGRNRKTGGAMKAASGTCRQGLRRPESLTAGMKPVTRTERAGVAERQVFVGWIFGS